MDWKTRHQRGQQAENERVSRLVEEAAQAQLWSQMVLQRIQEQERREQARKIPTNEGAPRRETM